MKKFSFFLLILLLTRVGTTYAAPNNGTTLDFQNFFLGSSAKPNVNVNQVLALLVGPEGKPGPAGVAGRDGFVGMNGQDGKDGLPGAPGPVGPQGAEGPAGASVIAVVLNTGDSNCANGGSKFISGDGTNTFACNGASGAPGAQGLPGEPGKSVVVDTSAAGVALVEANCENGGKALKDGNGTLTYVCNGTGGTGSGGFSAGINGLAGCSEVVEFSIIHHYSNSVKEFLLDGFKLKGLNVACLNTGNFAGLNFSIQNSGAVFYSSATYESGDSISCSNEITSILHDAAISAKNGSDEIDFIFGDVNLLAGQIKINPTCTIARNSATISLSQISSRDLGDSVAFEFTPVP